MIEKHYPLINKYDAFLCNSKIYVCVSFRVREYSSLTFISQSCIHHLLLYVCCWGSLRFSGETANLVSFNLIVNFSLLCPYLLITANDRFIVPLRALLLSLYLLFCFDWDGACRRHHTTMFCLIEIRVLITMINLLLTNHYPETPAVCLLM